MAVKIKSNVRKEARKLDRMRGPDAEQFTERNLNRLMRGLIPIFALATPKKTGEAARSIDVESDIKENEVDVRMVWDNDYIDDVNRNEGENQGFANNQFKSVANRIEVQAKQEISRAFKAAAEKNKLKVVR